MPELKSKSCRARFTERNVKSECYRARTTERELQSESYRAIKVWAPPYRAAPKTLLLILINKINQLIG